MTGEEMKDSPLDPEQVRGWYHTYVSDRCICRYCGFDGTRSVMDWLQLQGDHLIPRGVSKEHADDPLNRVTSCFYCNMIKRTFDPTEGRSTKVENREHQEQLVERARTEIKKRMEGTWSYGGGPEASFQFMMREVKK